MTPQQLGEHDALSRPIAELMRRSQTRPLLQSEFLKLMQLMTQQRIISNGLAQLRFDEMWPMCDRVRPQPALLEALFAPKLAEVRRLVSELCVAQGRKVVIFSQWRRMLRLAEWATRDLLGDKGLSTVFFTGAEKQSQRTQAVVDFHDDPRVAAMFLSDAGGVGLNLQRAASACINLELPWNPAVLEQRIGRIYRIGQTLPIDVYNLVCETGIEARIATTVSSKRALFEGLFDGTNDAVRFDGTASFLDTVKALVDLPSEDMPPASDPADDDAHADDASATAQALVEPDDTLTVETSAPRAPVRSSAASSSASSSVSSSASSSASSSVSSHAAAEALLSSLRVERTQSGGLRIEAPPEAARTLAAMFEGLGKLLGALAPPEGAVIHVDGRSHGDDHPRA